MSKSKFFSERLRQSAIVREIEIIGEAVKNIPVSFRRKYPSVEWIKISRDER
ncbi:MAG: HepT-like ribonuclease domain-containing protein [archaeon]